MKTYLCIASCVKTKKDIKDYTIKSYSEWGAKYLARKLFDNDVHYTPSLKKKGYELSSNVTWDCVEL